MHTTKYWHAHTSYSSENLYPESDIISDMYPGRSRMYTFRVCDPTFPADLGATVFV